MKPLVEKTLGLNAEYGLDEKLQFTALNIDSTTREITVYWQIAVVTTTGKVVEILSSGNFKRFDTEINPKYTQLEDSSLGQGIKYMLGLDLDLLPNFDQNV